jgi:hypothetical protein
VGAPFLARPLREKWGFRVETYPTKSLKTEQHHAGHDAQHPNGNDEEKWHRRRSIVSQVGLHTNAVALTFSAKVGIRDHLLQIRECLHSIQPSIQKLRKPRAQTLVKVDAALFVLAIHVGLRKSIHCLD